jgi:long-chain fatty acid transport protein
MRKLSAILIAIALLAGIPVTAMATNGMNLEGYGPISAGMGGTSFGFHNGTAAMMNNPATLGFFADGYHLDLAVGYLGPKITATIETPDGSMSAESESKSFWMPALGFFVKKSAWGYGIGVFGQGGMGTEYSSSSWMSDPSMGQNTALEQGLVNRSEVSVGRVIVPVTYDVNEKFTIGATFDFVWAGMDLQMAMSESQFGDMANPNAQNIGTATGSMVDAFVMLYEPAGGTGISQLYHAYFDFSNDSDFFGEAKGYGFAGKLGLTYEITPAITLGATYHSKTLLQDLETDNAKLNMTVNVDPGVFQGAPTGTYQDMDLAVAGKITIVDFQWPWVIGGGVAWDASEKLLLAFDLKIIGWESAMKDLKMKFKADDTAENGAFAGLEMDATLFQNWENQLVIALGGAYEATEALTLRGGYNYGKNPVPDQYVNALFPAIVEHHITVGAGYEWAEVNGINGSFQTGLESSATNPGDGTTMLPVESTHKQYNWQLMYSRSF